MKLRDLLIRNLDAILSELRQTYKSGPQILFKSVRTSGQNKRHIVTILIQIEEDCEANVERKENAGLN